MNGYIQLLTHLVGDYILQSDWMAVNKSKKTLPCLVHVLIYTACFFISGLLFGHISLTALLVIGTTHFIIDRNPILIKKLIWWKNRILKPYKIHTPSWNDCHMTGFDPARPDYIRVWLMIVVDNIFHLVINALAIGLL